MGVVMRSALTWVCLGLLANTATATLSQEAIDELEEELKNAADATGDYGLFVDPAENELFDLLQNDGQGDDDAAFEPPAQDEDPPARYPGDSSEVIESIDEIESITPIKSIQEVKSIKPVKSIEEIKSITPIKSIQEIDSITPIKAIQEIPDDIAEEFIKEHGLVPTDDDGYNSGYKGRPQVGAGRYGSDPIVESHNTAQDDFKQGLKDAIGVLNALVQELGDKELCGKGNEEKSFSHFRPSWSVRQDHNSKKPKLPFDQEDIESIDEITSMQEVKSMLPVKKITEVKSITPIKSIQEVTGLYELTDEQADQLRRLNAKWSRKSGYKRRNRRRF